MGLPCKTASCFQLGVRFPDGTLQTTAATTGVIFLGAWSSAVAYITGNEVTYLGGTYVAITASGPTATTPNNNPTAWVLVGGNATEIQGIPVNATPPTHNGELLIYDSLTNTYIPGDPLVQGIFPEGHTATGINPVLVSGKGLDGNQYDLAVDNTGHLIVNQGTSPWVVSLASTTITGTVAVTQSTSPWVVSFSAPQHVITDSGSVTNATLSAETTKVIGTVNQGTSPWVVSLTSTTITGTVAVTQSTSPWVISFSTPQHVIVDSGTITANQGTSPWVVSLASTTITGTVAVTQSTSPWVVSLASTTITGTVSVTQGTSPWVVSLTSTTVTNTVAENLIQVAGVTLGATAVVNYGSTPAAVAVPAVNAFITNTVPVTLTSTTITGTVAVTQSTSPWVVSLASTTITGTVSVTQGTSPWVVSLTSTTITGNVSVIGTTTDGTTTETNFLVVGGESNDATAQYQPIPLGPTGRSVIVEGIVGGVAQPVSLTSTTITGTVAVTQSTSPWVVSLTSTTITGTVSVTQGTSPWVVSLASTTITNTVAVTGALTNNNAAPTATLLGVLGAIAETAYATITYTTGDMVLPVTDLHGALNYDLQALSGTALGGPTTWGTAPTAEQVQGVNADCFQSTSPWVVSLTSTTITGTVAVTQSTSPWVVSLTSTTITNTVAENLIQVAGVTLGATAVTAFGTAPAAANVLGVNSSLFAGTTGITATGTSLNVNVTNATQVVVGNLTNNNAAPTTTNLGVLPAIAETSYATITYTTGNQVLPVTDLHGALNTDLQAVGGVAVVSAAAGVQKVGISGNAGATLDAVITAATAPTNGLSTLVVYNSTPPVLTTGQSVAVEGDTAGSAYVNNEGRKQTYRMTVAGFTPPTVVAGSPLFSIQGSATKTVRITHIRCSWAATTGQTTPAIISLQKFSVLSGGVTGNTPTASLNDSNNAAQTAVCLQYSTAPSTHTAIGGIADAENISWITGSVTVVGQATLNWVFGKANSQSLVLRGVAQYYGIIVSANAPSGPTMSITIEWTEE